MIGFLISIITVSISGGFGSSPKKVFIKGSMVFYEEGFFEPSFFILHNKFFIPYSFVEIKTNYDSLKVNTSGTGVGLDLKFNYNNFFITQEFIYESVLQVYEIWLGYEYIKFPRNFSNLISGSHIGFRYKTGFFSSGIEYNTIFGKISPVFLIGIMLL